MAKFNRELFEDIPIPGRAKMVPIKVSNPNGDLFKDLSLILGSYPQKWLILVV